MQAENVVEQLNDPQNDGVDESVSVDVDNNTDTEMITISQLNDTQNIGTSVSNTSTSNNINYNRHFFWLTIYIIFLPIFIIYAIFVRICSFIYRERQFFTIICIIILILIPIITLPVYFIMYKHFHHHQHHHESPDDTIKVVLSNVTLYQFDIQPTFSYNISFSLGIINYHSIAQLDITTNISLSYNNITLDSTSFQPFSLNSTQFKSLHFIFSGNNTYFNSSTTYYLKKYVYFYLLVSSSIQPHSSDKAFIYEVGCDIKVAKPPNVSMTIFNCAGL